MLCLTSLNQGTYLKRFTMNPAALFNPVEPFNLHIMMKTTSQQRQLRPADISTNHPNITKQLVATTQKIGVESSITELTSGGEASFPQPDITNESSVLERTVVPTSSSTTNTLSSLETSESPNSPLFYISPFLCSPFSSSSQWS